MVTILQRRDKLNEDSQYELSRFRAAIDATLSSGGVALGQTGHAFFPDTTSGAAYSHFRGVVYAAIRPIANTMASLPVRVAQVRRPGKRPAGKHIKAVWPVEGMDTALWAETYDGWRFVLPRHLKAVAPNLELFESHPVLDRIESPNPIMTDWHLKWLTVAGMDLAGWCPWWIPRGGKTIWPLPANWVQAKHEGRPYSGWRIFSGGGLAAHDVPSDEVVMFHYPSPSHLLETASPVQAQIRAVNADEALQLCQEAIFQQGIFPRYAFMAGSLTDEDGQDVGPPRLTSEQRDILETAIMRMWGGSAKTGRPILLDAIFKDLKRISSTAEEMDFLESGKTTYQRITQGIGSPPYVMGDREPASRAASAESRRIFGDFTINPRAELQSKVLTKSLAPRFAAKAQKVVVWLEPYTPDDREERRADWELLAKYSSTWRDELRAALLGLPPMRDGQTIPQPPATVLVPAEPAPVRSVKSPADGRFKAWEKAQAAAESKLAAVAESYLASQRADVQCRLRSLLRASGGSLAAAPVEVVMAEIYDQVDWHEALVAAFRLHAERLATEGAVRELARSPKFAKQRVAFGELAPEVQQAVSAEVETIMTRPYWQDMGDVTRRRLADTLAEGIAAGESEYELIVRIGDSPTVPGVTGGVLGSASNTVRAACIARTESGRFLNAGHFAQQQEFIREGLASGSEWNATLDQYTRPSHFALHGKQVPRDFPDGWFLVGDERARYPGDPSLSAKNTANCRCTILAVLRL